MQGIFVTGTDTGVGKTVICAGLVSALQGSRKVCYWKPVQTGTLVGDDTREVREVTKIADDDVFMEPGYRFAEPLSPHFAAEKWGKKIETDLLLAQFKSKREQGYYTIVEGAGGLLVPYNELVLQVDFMQMLRLPILIVSEDRVGAINQTLLTLNAARERKLDILGVILTRSRGNLGNGPAISHFGKVEILAEVPPMEDNVSATAFISCHPKIRQILSLPPVPN